MVGLDIYVRQRADHIQEPAARQTRQVAERALRWLSGPASALRGLQAESANRRRSQSEGGSCEGLSRPRQGASDAGSGVHEGMGAQEDCRCGWGCLRAF